MMKCIPLMMFGHHSGDGFGTLERQKVLTDLLSFFSCPQLLNRTHIRQELAVGARLAELVYE